MGVLNVTPDSFSDGGKLLSAGRPSLDKVLARTAQMLSEGAAIIDVGGESTRPGAAPVSVQQELDRVIPVVEAISARFDTIVSVDTSAAEVMAAAAAAGAGLINDVRALVREGALAAAVATGLPVCLMHMQGKPQTMQCEPRYSDVIGEVSAYLLGRLACCRAAGIDDSQIVLDPGFGFGKSAQHNLSLLNRLPSLVALGYPVLVGLSRKSVIGAVLARDVEGRLAGSLSLAVLAVDRGATIIRAHDIQQTVDAVAMTAAVLAESLPQTAS